MPVKIRCPSRDCGKTGVVSEQRIGQMMRCPFCGAKFKIEESALNTMASEAVSRTMPEVVGISAHALTESPRVQNQPQTIGRFNIRVKLGAGASGAVYRAYDAQLEREVALKVPHPGTLDTPLRVERFFREAKAAARLRHPHIVPVFEAGVDGGSHFIASAFIEGRTLAHAVDEGPMDFRRAAQCVRQLAEALAYAHQQNIVHRDVKSANVMLDAQDQPHLMDFGLAFRQEALEKLTHDGAVLGTPSYMAPEQARGQKGDPLPASDQYSLGVVLYECLAGQTPFSGPPHVVLYNAIHTEPEPPHKHNASIPIDLERICLKAMSKDPSARYLNCSEMAEDLRRWLDGEPIKARPMGPWERALRWARREPAMALGAAALATCLLLVAVVSIVASVRMSAAADVALRAQKEAEQHRDRAEDARKETESALAEAKKAREDADAARIRAEDASAERSIAAKKAEEALEQLKKSQDSELAARLAEEKQRLETQEALRKADQNLYFYQRDLLVAKKAFDDLNFAEADKLLERCKEPMRGWEWQQMKDDIQKQKPIWSVPFTKENWTSKEFADYVSLPVMSPDGAYLATSVGFATRDFSIRDAKTGAEVCSKTLNWPGKIPYDPPWIGASRPPVLVLVSKEEKVVKQLAALKVPNDLMPMEAAIPNNTTPFELLIMPPRCSLSISESGLRYAYALPRQKGKDTIELKVVDDKGKEKSFWVGRCDYVHVTGAHLVATGSFEDPNSNSRKKEESTIIWDLKSATRIAFTRGRVHHAKVSSRGNYLVADGICAAMNRLGNAFSSSPQPNYTAMAMSPDERHVAFARDRVVHVHELPDRDYVLDTNFRSDYATASLPAWLEGFALAYTAGVVFRDAQSVITTGPQLTCWRFAKDARRAFPAWIEASHSHKLQFLPKSPHYLLWWAQNQTNTYKAGVHMRRWDHKDGGLDEFQCLLPGPPLPKNIVVSPDANYCAWLADGAITIADLTKTVKTITGPVVVVEDKTRPTLGKDIQAFAFGPLAGQITAVTISGEREIWDFVQGVLVSKSDLKPLLQTRPKYKEIHWVFGQKHMGLLGIHLDGSESIDVGRWNLATNEFQVQTITRQQLMLAADTPAQILNARFAQGEDTLALSYKGSDSNRIGICRFRPALSFKSLEAAAWDFHPDGKRLVTTTGRTLRIFETNYFEEVVEFQVKPADPSQLRPTVLACTFSPDGKSLAIAQTAGMVVLGTPP